MDIKKELMATWNFITKSCFCVKNERKGDFVHFKTTLWKTKFSCIEIIHYVTMAVVHVERGSYRGIATQRVSDYAESDQLELHTERKHGGLIKRHSCCTDHIGLWKWPLCNLC